MKCLILPICAFLCLFMPGCADIILNDCDCPKEDIVLRCFNQDMKKMWVTIPAGSLNEKGNMILTPEEAKKEQKQDEDPYNQSKDNKYGI